MLRCTEEVVRRLENPLSTMFGFMGRQTRQGNVIFQRWQVGVQYAFETPQQAVGRENRQPAGVCCSKWAGVILGCHEMKGFGPECHQGLSGNRSQLLASLQQCIVAGGSMCSSPALAAMGLPQAPVPLTNMLVQELVRGLLKHVQAINGVPGSFADLLLNLKDCKSGVVLYSRRLAAVHAAWIANRTVPLPLPPYYTLLLCPRHVHAQRLVSASFTSKPCKTVERLGSSV